MDATPRLAFDPELILAALDVRLLLLDVDGVLTPGDLLYGAQGEELKRFSTLDGHGLKLLMSAGIEPVVISGRDSPALRARIAELGLQHSVLGSGAKLPAAQSLLDQLQLSWEQVAIIGDDWPDLALIARAGFSAAPPQSHPEVLARVCHVTRAPAGLGAVREVCDLLLMARGAYAALLQDALDGKPHTSPPGRPKAGFSPSQPPPRSGGGVATPSPLVGRAGVGMAPSGLSAAAPVWPAPDWTARRGVASGDAAPCKGSAGEAEAWGPTHTPPLGRPKAGLSPSQPPPASGGGEVSATQNIGCPSQPPPRRGGGAITRGDARSISDPISGTLAEPGAVQPSTR